MSGGSERVGDAGEFPLLDRFPGWFAGVDQPAVTVGPGDDAAVLRAAFAPDAPEVVLTTDACIEGVHYLRDWCTPADVGWRALAAAVSDVAAMGGRPLGAVVALAVPAQTPVADLRAFGQGLHDCGAWAACPVVGGNLARAPGGWHVATSVLGTAGDRWLRSGAQPGDGVWVSGRPGRAHAGLRALQAGLPPGDAGVADALNAFRRPKPRFLVADALRGYPVHAAIDLSDGLARTLERLATASGCGVRIEAAALPQDPATDAVAAALGEDARGYVRQGGESFELCVTAPAGALDAVAGALADAELEWTAIGAIVEGSGVVLVDGDSEAPLEPASFEHFA